MRNSHKTPRGRTAMRKFILATAIAALGAAVVASPAFAFDHHFTVLARGGTIKQVGPHLFLNKERLFDPNNRHDKVGRDRGLCREKPRKFVCHLVVHLNGEIGGFGDIKVKGDLDPGPDRLVVIGGSDDFNGVAGKMTVDSTKKGDKIHFDLVR
jgi:hypothetical protein